MRRALFAVGMGVIACSDDVGRRTATAEFTIDGGGYLELSDSSPKPNATEVYPSPFGDGRRTGFDIELRFSVPMDVDVAELPFGPRAAAPRSAPLSWSPDGLQATITIAPPPLAAQTLLDNTEYELDLEPLASAAGAPLSIAPPLVDGKLRFATGTYDALLNHSCGHTVFGPFGSGSASASVAFDGDFRGLQIDTTHKQYSITLPSSASGTTGYVMLAPQVLGRYRLYFDQLLRLGEVGMGELEPIPVIAAANSCPGIRAQADIEVTARGESEAKERLLRLETQSQDRLNLIVEALTQ